MAAEEAAALATRRRGHIVARLSDSRLGHVDMFLHLEEVKTEDCIVCMEPRALADAEICQGCRIVTCKACIADMRLSGRTMRCPACRAEPFSRLPIPPPVVMWSSMPVQSADTLETLARGASWKRWRSNEPVTGVQQVTSFAAPAKRKQVIDLSED